MVKSGRRELGNGQCEDRVANILATEADIWAETSVESLNLRLNSLKGSRWLLVSELCQIASSVAYYHHQTSEKHFYGV